jgi:hypothetical protein
LDGESVLHDKLAPITASMTTTPKKIENAHLGIFQAILYGNFYTGYVKGTAEWTAALEVSMTAAGPFKAIGQTVLRPTADGVKASIITTAEMVQAMVPGAEYFRLNMAKVGTPGSLLFGAYMAPQEDQ